MTFSLPGLSQYAAYSEYTYEYEGQILSGLPDVSREYAGLKIKSNVKLQVHSSNRFLMQVRYCARGRGGMAYRIWSDC